MPKSTHAVKSAGVASHQPGVSQRTIHDESTLLNQSAARSNPEAIHSRPVQQHSRLDSETTSAVQSASNSNTARQKISSTAALIRFDLDGHPVGIAKGGTVSSDDVIKRDPIR